MKGFEKGPSPKKIEPQKELTGKDLSLAVSEWMKAKKAAAERGEEFTVPRPGSQAAKDLESQKVEEEHKKVIEQEEAKRIALEKKKEIFRPEGRPELHIVGKINLGGETEIKKEPLQKQEEKEIPVETISNRKINQGPKFIGKIELPGSTKTAKEEKQSYSIVNDEEQVEALLKRANLRVFSVIPDPKEFSDFHSEEVIERDLAYVKEYETYFSEKGTKTEKHTKKLATILEAILADGLSRYEWIGKTIRLYPASKYDEIHHGVDGILEIDEGYEDKFLALGIDVTFGTSKTALKRKFSKLTESIRNGYLTKVKYFLDEKEEPMDSFYAPKIILAVPIQELEELMSLWATNNHEELKKHRIRSELFVEAFLQCKLLAEYAEKHNQEEVQEAYETVLRKLERIIDSGPAYLRTAFMNDEKGVIERIKNLIYSADGEEEKEVA